MKHTSFYLTALLLLFLSTNSVKAQKINALINYDTMTYVYKLDYEHMKSILEAGTVLDANKLYTNKFREYPKTKFKTDTLPYGHFIIANINDNLVHYSFYTSMPFLITTKVIDNDIIIFLRDKKNKKLLKDAKLTLQNKPINYDAGYGGYAIDKKEIDIKQLKILLKISYSGEIYSHTFSLTQGSKPVVSDNPYEHRGTYSSPGYILLDKPKYKVLDSLHLKAFLFKYTNGGPLRKKAFLTIYDPISYYTLTQKIKPRTPGAFIFDWKIPDSLKIDRYYNVSLSFKKRGRTFLNSTKFKLEEYELNKNTYDIDLPNQVLYAGDDAKIYASAKDMNGFPLQGTQLHVSLRIDEVMNIMQDTFTLTREKKNEWYSLDTTLEYDNFIEIKIPSNQLLNANAKYTLLATFTDPITFEKKAFAKSFIKYCQAENRLFYQAEDSIHVRNLYNGKDTANNYFFITLNGTDTISKTKITTPFHYKLQELETQAILIDKDSLKTPLLINYNKLEITKVQGQRTGDSIRISFKYPFLEPVHYKIYKKNKLVAFGENSELAFTALDKSMDEYRILLSTNLQSGLEQNFYEIKYVPEKNKLHFENTIPRQALPGDSLTVEITAKDFHNKPRKNINIAAYAINKAFEEEIQIPYIEVPAKYQNKVDINPVKQYDYATFNNTINSLQVSLDSQHFKRFNLYKNEYYQHKYPKNELSEIHIKKQTQEPEFSIFVTHKHNMYAPKYILLDGQPVFIGDINQNKPYSIAASSGKHTIAFRYFDKLYEIKDIQLKDYHKTLFGINYDSIKKQQSRFKQSDSLSILEPTNDEKEILYKTLLVTNMFQADSVKVVSSNKNYEQHYYSSYTIKSLNIDGDNYFVQGPFTNVTSVELKVNNTSHNLKPGIHEVYHYDAILKEFIPKKMPPIKGAFMHFRENNLSNAHLVQLLVMDTIAPTPIETKLEYQPKTAKAIAIKEEENFYQSYRSSLGGEGFTIMLKDNADSSYVKSMWVISKSNFQACDFIQYVNRPIYNHYKSNVKDTFDIYLFLNKNRMCVLKNQTHLPYDEFYLNIQKLKTEPFEKEKIEIPLKIYSELNDLPLTAFNEIPFETSQKIKAINKTNRNNTTLHGIVSDESQQPIHDVIVYLEMNGRFKYGGKTNANGMFEILDILPGTYQVKIVGSGYKPTHFETMLFEPNKEYEVLSSLKEAANGSPLFQTLQHDFHMQAYAKHNQENTMQIQIHEKSTREKLNGVHCSMLKNGKQIKDFTLSEHQMSLVFPKQDEHLYTLILSKPGYTTLRLNGIEFVNKYYYRLDAFIGLEKKEIIKIKEYNLGMQGLLQPIQAEEINFRIVEEKYEKGKSMIYGKITDQNNEALDFVTIKATQNDVVMGGSKSDIDGNYKIMSLKPGTYDLKFTYAGYQTEIISNVIVRVDKSIRIDLNMEQASNELKSVKVTSYRTTLIEQATTNRTIDRVEIKRSANTISASEPMSMSSGSYSYNATAPMSVGGDKESATIYMIDGVPVRSVSDVAKVSLSSSSMDEAETFENGMSAKYGNANGGFVEKDMIAQIAANKNTSTLRKDFSDVGFWKPNMVTNKQGKVFFTLKLPDNITAWKSYIIGAGRKWMHGIDSSEIKVYKPLQTTCIVPNYLYQGDKALSKIKFTNLTKDSLQIQTQIKLQGVSKLKQTATLKNNYLDSLWIEALQKDTIIYEGGLTYQTNYKDFEQYKIPVMSKAMKFSVNQSLLMEKDETYTLQIPPHSKGSIIFNNNLYEKVISVINDLNKYEFGCVEQTASKLKALLLKDKLQRKLGITPDSKREIDNLLAKLFDMQNHDGSFGWWRKNGQYDRMTIYAMEVCSQALRQGFMNNIANSTTAHITQHFQNLNTSDKIYAMHVLLEYGAHIEDAKQIYKKINPEEISTTDKIFFYQNKLKMNEEVSKSDLYAVMLSIQNNVAKSYADNFFYDSKADLFTAYSLFKNTSYGTEFINLFRKKLLAGQFEKNLNTYSKAKMIEALTSDALSDTSKPIQAKIIINDSISSQSFPFTIPIQHTNYVIKHSGGDVFVNTSEENWIDEPIKRDTNFSVRTYFQQKGTSKEKLSIGTETNMLIDIQSFKSGENVMLEIPIPAGMKIKQKNTTYAKGDYVEYYKHKVFYFFQHLEMGTRQISIPMMPVFKGSYVLPATKISLMYYPFVYGNNENSVIIIE